MSGARGTAPSIAVILPNRNDARYLPRCLRSVLEQEVQPDELIVIDDQSTDDSVAVIRSLIAGHAHARLVENPVNLGVYGAVDEGLKRSRSDYALFLAANDFVLPGIFSRAKACLARAPGVGVWSALAWIVDEDDRLMRLHPSPVVALDDVHIPAGRCIELLHRLGAWFTGTTLIYRRSAVDEAGRFDPAYKGLADWFTAIRVASRYGAAYSPVPLAAIRKHRGSYLMSSLAEPAALDEILQRLCEEGTRTAPELFTPVFIRRTVQRFRFTSVLGSGGATLAQVAERSSGRARAVLGWSDRLLPRSWRFFRAALAFVVLRPFDLWSTLWNRSLGWLLVRARARRPAEP